MAAVKVSGLGPAVMSAPPPSVTVTSAVGWLVSASVSVSVAPPSVTAVEPPLWVTARVFVPPPAPTSRTIGAAAGPSAPPAPSTAAVMKFRPALRDAVAQRHLHLALALGVQRHVVGGDLDRRVGFIRAQVRRRGRHALRVGAAFDDQHPGGGAGRAGEVHGLLGGADRGGRAADPGDGHPRDARQAAGRQHGGPADAGRLLGQAVGQGRAAEPERHLRPVSSTPATLPGLTVRGRRPPGCWPDRRPPRTAAPRPGRGPAAAGSAS